MLDEYLSEKRDAIVTEWYERITSQYPPETAKFLREQADPFANPVGAGLRDELGPLYDAVVVGNDVARIDQALDRIIRVRAVQAFEPSQALAFLVELKRVIRGRVVSDGLECAAELAALDDRIDGLLLAAVDVYSRCREEIFEIRVKDVRNRSLKMMERLNEWRARRDEVGGPEAAEPH
jgi:hypothetical protein